MGDAKVERSSDQHEWTLRDYHVTQLLIDPTSFRFQIWTLQAAAEIRLGVPFEFTEVDGRGRTVDPSSPEQLSPLLTLTGRKVQRLVVTKLGELHIRFADGSAIRCAPHPQYEAWEVQSSGDLAEMSYLCDPGGGSPWGGAV